MEVFLAMCISLFCSIWLFHIIRRRRDPPGPLGIPFFGIMFYRYYQRVSNQLNRNFEYNMRMGKKYGPVWSFELGLQKVVILHSYEAILKASMETGYLFAGRSQCQFNKAVTKGVGVANVDGDLWKVHRRFTISSLKTLGMGNKILEPAIISEVDYITDLIRGDLGKPVNSSELFVKGITNIIAVLVFGERWGYDDPNFLQYVKYAHNVTQAKGFSIFLPFFYPFLAKSWLTPFLTEYNKLLFEVERLRAEISKKFMNHKVEYDSSENPRDLIEAYLHQQYLEEKSNSGTDNFSDSKCIGNCMDLFIAGMDTTTTNLRWCMVMLSLYPEVQNRLHAEIDETIGQSSVPQMEDKKRMPYCQAVLDEVARFCTVAPLAVHKRVMEDTVFMGHTISAQDIVFVNLFSVHHDEYLWDNPYSFNPNRFLDDNGVYKPSQYLLSFGIGKRKCLGEGLAQMENYLLFTSLMQKFSVSLDEKSLTRVDEILSGTDGIVHSPGPHHIIFEERNPQNLVE